MLALKEIQFFLWVLFIPFSEQGSEEGRAPGGVKGR